jgi:hypothetical protein
MLPGIASLLLCTAVAADETRTQRVVAVGDLHGDLDNAIQALQLAEVVDEKGHWVAGPTVLVQTGDTTDRGPDSTAVMDLVMRLTQEAAVVGGQVVALLGNHEVMNLHGDWRYVSEGDVDAFGTVEQRRHAFSPMGTYGQWLSTLPVVAKVGDTVFCHGGIHPDVAALGIDAINERAQAQVWTGGDLHGEMGPTWYRELVLLPEDQACAKLNRSLIALGARRMVVGHTTRRDGKIEARCKGALTIIDTGISDHYGSNLAAWVLVADDAKAIYTSGAIDLPDPQ